MSGEKKKSNAVADGNQGAVLLYEAREEVRSYVLQKGFALYSNCNENLLMYFKYVT